MADTDIACEIIEGRLAAEIVLRTPDVIAFLDHRPVFKGHVLVCPTRHVDTMLDLPAELVVPLFDACRRIAAAMTTALFSRLMANSSLSFCDGAQSWCVRMIVNVWLQARRLAKTAVSSIEA